MKKITIFLLASMFFFSQASAAGLNIGISGSAGVFHATGSENENGEDAASILVTVTCKAYVFYSKTFIKVSI